MRAIIPAFTLALALTGCVTGTPATDIDDDTTDTASAALVQGEMIIYEAGQPIPQSELVDLGPPGALGGTVLEGDPAISARVDHASGPFLAGVFQATRGKVLIHFPFTEHATILAGEVALTDATGHHAVLRPGDSYLIHQGSDIVWDVTGDLVQKSFFNRVEPADSPSPMRSYANGSLTADTDLVDLGPPGSLGGTVLEGNPAISARVDYAQDGLLAGVFQATRGTVLIDFPFTEHATITRGKVRLTDEAGNTRVLKPGDAYLIAQDSQIHWDVPVDFVQESFFNYAAP
ncbi:MAG: cupin domain-containing protein [Polyangiaceae bacterium]